MVTVQELVTAKALEKKFQSDAHVELVRGVVITMPPAGHEHGAVAGALLIQLGAFVLQKGFGKVYAAETGFILAHNPDTVRAPDAAFVTSERAAQQEGKEGFFDGPPDLAVEVVSPSDRDEDVQAKVLDYLVNGVRLVWIIRPRTRTVTVFRSLTDIRVLTDADTLEGGDLLPGFSLAVKAIFGG